MLCTSGIVIVVDTHTHTHTTQATQSLWCIAGVAVEQWRNQVGCHMCSALLYVCTVFAIPSL